MLNTNKRYTLMLDEEEVDIIIGRIKWHQSSNNKRYKTINHGEINVIGEPRLVEIEITGQICRSWPYAEQKKKSPEDTIEHLERFLDPKNRSPLTC